MKKYTLILFTTFLMLILRLDKLSAQEEGWYPVVDTLKIDEVAVIDSAIVTILDSAFTFLRLPPSEFGVYYYTLHINEVTLAKDYSIHEIFLYVKDFYSIGEWSTEWLKNSDRFLFNYKGVQILIKYRPEDNDTAALDFFKLKGNKANYYRYSKKYKGEPYVVYLPEKIYEQSIKFIHSKGRISFIDYKLNIRK